MYYIYLYKKYYELDIKMFLAKCHKVYKEIFVSHNKGSFLYSELEPPTSLILYPMPS